MALRPSGRPLLRQCQRRHIRGLASASCADWPNHQTSGKACTRTSRDSQTSKHVHVRTKHHNTWDTTLTRGGWIGCLEHPGSGMSDLLGRLSLPLPRLQLELAIDTRNLPTLQDVLDLVELAISLGVHLLQPGLDQGWPATTLAFASPLGRRLRVHSTASVITLETTISGSVRIISCGGCRWWRARRGRRTQLVAVWRWSPLTSSRADGGVRPRGVVAEVATACRGPGVTRGQD